MEADLPLLLIPCFIMFNLFRRKSVTISKDYELEPKTRLSPTAEHSRHIGSHRYSHYSSVTSGRDSPPQIVLYSRPPENLTSPNRDTSPDPQELTLQVQAQEPKQAHPHQQPNNFHKQQIVEATPPHFRIQRKYSRHARSGTDVLATTTTAAPSTTTARNDIKKSSSVRRSRSSSGPLSLLRRSLKRSSIKKHSFNNTTTTTTTNHVTGSHEKVSRKFSDPTYTSTAGSSGPKFLPGRATSPKNLITLKPVCPNSDQDNMYSMILPDSYYQPQYQLYNGGYPPMSMHEQPYCPMPDVPATPKTVPSYSTVEHTDHVVQQSNGHAAAPAATHTPSRFLPQTPSNLGVPYYPPPPQAVSANAGSAEQTRSRRSSKDNSDQKSGQSFRPPVLRISMRSKVRI